jgi:hypothetical protein
MTRRIRRILLCAGACVAGAVGAVGAMQSASQPAVSHEALDQVRIDVVNEQLPIAEAAKQVERRFGRVVTYEGVVYVAPSDFVDSTDQVANINPRATNVRVLRGDSIRLAYVSRYEALDDQAGEALTQLLAVWNGGNHSGKFRVERVAGGYHVIPVARRGLDETTEPYSSPLDTRITVPIADRDGAETIAVLAQAITDASGRSVHPGRLPINHLMRTRVTIGAEHQTAREVLWHALQAMDPALSWQLNCGTVGDSTTCSLNLHFVGAGS